MWARVGCQSRPSAQPGRDTAADSGPKEPAPAPSPSGVAARQNRFSQVRCVATVGEVPTCGNLRQGASVCGPGLGVAQSASPPDVPMAGQ